MLRLLALSTLVLSAASGLRAGDWPQWRGPELNGSCGQRNLPEQWSKTENVAWAAELPGVAASTPVVADDRVYLSGVDSQKGTLLAMAMDRASGKMLWRLDVAEGIRKDSRSNFASNSPVTDGKLAFFYYGNGELVCVDAGGGRRWARNIQKDFGPFAMLWTYSSSPLLYEGKLYVQVLQRNVPVGGCGRKDGPNDPYLLALDPATGQTLWRVVRPSQAIEESREAFTTPIPWTHEGHKQILVVGGDCLTGHDPETGRELWRWGTYNPKRISHWRLVPSPVVGDGVVLVCGPKGSPIFAVKPSAPGELGDRDLAWVSRDEKQVSSDVPTPAFYDGDFFVLSDVRKALSRIQPRTGKVKWTLPMPGRGKYEASPLAADGKIYCINFDGQVAVVDAAKGSLLRAIAMDEPAAGEVVRSSIIAAGGQLFIRTTRKLYCIGKMP